MTTSGRFQNTHGIKNHFQYLIIALPGSTPPAPASPTPTPPSLTPAAVQTSLSDVDNVIVCSLCGFSGFRVRDIVHHLTQHPGSTLNCGVDGCPSEYNNLRSFKSHLNIHHPSFYPDIIDSVPSFEPNSIFLLRNRDLSNNIDNTFIDNYPEPEFTFDNNSPASPQSLNSFSVNIEGPTREFLKILVTKGCQNNIPFNAMKELTSSLIDFLSDASYNNILTDDLIHNMLNSINNSDRFDICLENYFNCCFPESINIRGTDQSFVVFNFKKIFSISCF